MPFYYIDQGIAPCPLLHPIDTIGFEQNRRNAERKAKLDLLLRNSSHDQHALIRQEFRLSLVDADLDLLDPDLHDLCPACCEPLPPGYLTQTVTNADGSPPKDSTMPLNASHHDDYEGYVPPPNLATPEGARAYHKAELARLIRCAREIVGVGSNYDYERFDFCRRLSITVTPGVNGSASLAIFMLSGSPPRGAVCVNLSHDGAFDSRHISSGRQLEHEEVSVLRSLLASLSGSQYDYTPIGFTWISPTE